MPPQSDAFNTCIGTSVELNLGNHTQKKNGSWSMEVLVDMLNDKFRSNDVDKVLLWAHDHFRDGELIQLSSFGPSGVVILHKLLQLGILQDIAVVSIDTLHLFPETYAFVEDLKKNYQDMKLHTFRPEGFDCKEGFDEAHGEDLWQTDPDKYDQLAKVEPTERAMKQMNATARINGRRSGQGGARAALEIFSVDNLDPDCLKINPLAHWTSDDVWSYIREHDIPYNPLHDQGYKSIGDVMTSKPVGADAPERSGRFSGMGNKTECGIHSVNRPKKQKNTMRRSQSIEKVWEILSPQLLAEEGKENEATRNKIQIIETEDEWEELIQDEEQLVVVKFFATWCKPCKSMAPFYKTLSSEYDATFAKVDIDELDEVVEEFEVVSMPTFVLLKGNSPIATIKGADEEVLKKALDEHLPRLQ